MVAVEDEQFGGLGLKFKRDHKFCNGMFTAQNGLIVAHDIVEHQQGTKRIGTIGDEMVAIGGIVFTRAQWGEMTRNRFSFHSPEESVASDVIEMARLYFDFNVPFRQKLVKTREPDLGFIIDQVIECSRYGIRKEFESSGIEASTDQIDSYLAQSQDYMLHGVKLATRRFGDGITANNLFWNIEQATDVIASNLEFEGQTFRLSYDLGKAYMEETYEDEYY